MVMRDEIDYAEPIPRPVVAEIVQLLGYDQHTVVRVSIEQNRVTVVTAEIVGHEVIDVMHLHTIV